MKKIISILLTLCMLLTMFVVPAIAEEAQAEETLNYYKWDFSKGKLYTNYEKPVKPEGATYDFVALNKDGSRSVEYAEFNGLDALKIKASKTSNHFMFTPLKEDGTPFVLEAGKEYYVSAKIYVKKLGAGYGRPYIELYTTADGALSSYATYTDDAGVAHRLTYDNSASPSDCRYGFYTGAQVAYWATGRKIETKSGSYTPASSATYYDGYSMTTAAGVNTFTLANSDYGDIGVAADGKEGYVTFNHFVALLEDADLKTYGVTKNDDGTYNCNGKTHVPLFGISLPGAYKSLWIEGYDADAFENKQDANGNWYHRSYAEYYVTELAIAEKTDECYVNFHEYDEIKTVTGNVGENVPFYVPVAPKGKYFAGWSTVKDNASALVDSSAFTYVPGDLYAVYKDSVTDGSTYTYNYEGEPAINGVGYIIDGKYGDEVGEGGSAGEMGKGDPAPRIYSKDGLELGKDISGGAYKWDVTKDNTNSSLTAQIANWDQTAAVAVKPNVDVGETAAIGWSEAHVTVIRDKDGNVAVPKPNTKYAAVVTLKRIGAGNVSLYLVADRKAKYVTGKTGNSTNTTISNVSEVITVPSEVDGEFVTSTVYFETSSYDNSVPVLSLSMASSVIGERLKEADGKESINVNGTDYHPYKIIDHGRVLIKEIKLVEIDPNNVAVTYNYYEEGVGFSADIKDAAPGTPIDVSTKNVDEKWYNNKAAQANQIVTTYPTADAIYYNATYMQTVAPENKFGNGCHNGQSEKVITFESTEVDVDGATDYALHISTSEGVITNDQECMILEPGLQHGHTYKVSYKYKANAVGSRFGFVFRTAQDDNFWSKTDNADLCTSYVANATTGEWTEKAVYFTVDLLGTLAPDTDENGTDYILSRDNRNNLFITYVQDAGKTANDLYFIDFQVEDLGVVVDTAAASILTDAAAHAAGDKQAMRYYFTYETTDGSDITLGGEPLKVVERGFLYRNGYIEPGKTESAKFRADNSAVLKKAKDKDFDICWAYDNKKGVMKFSTYVTGFELNDTSKKLEVKAYLLVKNSTGEQFYIYSDSINRTVAGVGVGTDTDINIGK